MVLNVKLVFHLIVTIINIFTTYSDFVIIRDDEKGRNAMGGKFKFLTVWCIILQTLYFGFSVIVDLSEQKAVSENKSLRTGLHKFRDVFHGTIAFPLATFVASTFWTLYAMDRELVHPKKLDAMVPAWLNHSLHTTIVPFIIFDKMVVQHFYPRRLYGLLASSALSLLYLIWILLIAYLDDFWVYPVLQHMSPNERITFIVVCMAFFSSFYILGESLTKFLWGSQRKPSRSQKTQQLR